MRARHREGGTLFSGGGNFITFGVALNPFEFRSPRVKPRLSLRFVGLPVEKAVERVAPRYKESGLQRVNLEWRVLDTSGVEYHRHRGYNFLVALLGRFPSFRI